MNGYLLDENLPTHVLPKTIYPVVTVRDLGRGMRDSSIWELAQREGWAIVSKDTDFADRILITDPPPWIIHLRIGNLRLAELRSTVARLWPQVEALLPTYKLINVYHDRIEALATR